MHKKIIVTRGKKIEDSGKVLIMLHGRGGSAEDILTIAAYLNVKEYTLLAPQATNYSWYPYSFLAPMSQNEPWLSSALNLIKEITGDLNAVGIGNDKIFFLGFSQGACLTLEYVARNAGKYGGIVGFTGGLLGDKIEIVNYKGDFKGTPIFIGCDKNDPHVPVERVEDTAVILQNMGAAVTKKIYDQLGHTINQDEIDEVNGLVFSKKDKDIKNLS